MSLTHLIIGHRREFRPESERIAASRCRSDQTDAAKRSGLYLLDCMLPAVLRWCSPADEEMC